MAYVIRHCPNPINVRVSYHEIASARCGGRPLPIEMVTPSHATSNRYKCECRKYPSRRESRFLDRRRDNRSSLILSRSRTSHYEWFRNTVAPLLLVRGKVLVSRTRTGSMPLQRGHLSRQPTSGCGVDPQRATSRAPLTKAPDRGSQGSARCAGPGSGQRRDDAGRGTFEGTRFNTRASKRSHRPIAFVGSRPLSQGHRHSSLPRAGKHRCWRAAPDRERCSPGPGLDRSTRGREW